MSSKGEPMTYAEVAPANSLAINREFGKKYLFNNAKEGDLLAVISRTDQGDYTLEALGYFCGYSTKTERSYAVEGTHKRTLEVSIKSLNSNNIQGFKVADLGHYVINVEGILTENEIEQLQSKLEDDFQLGVTWAIAELKLEEWASKIL